MMIDIAIISKIRKAAIWAGLSLAAFFGIIAVISLVISGGAFEKPMQYRSVIPDITLNPGERKVLEFESFCLDSGRGSPRRGDDYSLMNTPAIKLRPYLRDIFNEYLSHPSRWKQGDVQQAVWYTQGNKKWQDLQPEQRDFIMTATGKEDPISGHPVILLSRMASIFGTVVKTNLLLAFLVLVLMVIALPFPSAYMERGISWMVSPRLAQKITRGRPGEMMDDFALNPKLQSLRSHIDVLFTRLVYRIFSRRR
ncbi:MAG: hypothetical protein BWX99_02415 [Deltaproteobacteria bacterium ADurb.Bin151]|jgi:hypothetical protein|nr:hypothetical protein [Smithella sp.]OQB53218.1 MAG: hypothetical protein BWX99_02415 [Deltaproteobacteria bacterium ADurb.Bin151]HNZ10903.1 hypothetical protein [Smithellaceae bacterium]HOG82461.1 hypothetical protein [Smithellaceae bacterium]HOQ40591.1 hypothetical protein [Smithellaceae bacterium]